MNRRGSGGRGRLAAVVCLSVVVVLAAPGWTPAAGAANAAVRRVLMISLPHVPWSDLGHGATPHLDAVLDDSSVANLSVRAARRQTTPGDGYASIGAGTRAGGPRLVDGIVLAPDEPFEEGTGAEAYQRRSGHRLRGAAGVLSAASYEALNDRLRFGGEVGALGQALDEAGVTAAVIANADPSRTSGDQSAYVRPAAAALMTRHGELGAGRVDRGLLMPDPAAPYGHRLNPDAVLRAFDEVWRDRSVVLVEASDIALAEAYSDWAVRARGAALTHAALGWTDAMVGRLLRRVDPQRDAVIVVAPATPRHIARLTVAAVRSPAHAPSLAGSASTRRPGLVTIADVGPTVLDLLAVDRPASMEGRPIKPDRPGGAAAERRDYLLDMERDARFRDSLVTPVYYGFVVAVVLLSLLTVMLLRGRGERIRPVLEIAALVMLAFLPCTYLAGLFPFSRLGKMAYLAFVTAAAVSLGAAAWRLDRGRSAIRPLVTLLGVILAVLAGSAVTGSSLQLNTVFGDSPIVAGRFFGINNLSFAQLATASMLMAAFCAHHFQGRRRAFLVAGLLAATVILTGLPAFGANVGSVLSSVPAFVLVAALLFGMRFRPRLVVLAVAGTATAITSFVFFDLSHPPTDRSHLGRVSSSRWTPAAGTPSPPSSTASSMPTYRS